jgi:phthiocerol/phenolphthiocerol synthesis type-I polyketide synthase E
LPWLSNLTGTWITGEQATDAGYWRQQMGAPVQFAANLAEVLAEEEVVLLEVGPGQSLSTFARQMARPEQLVLNLLRHPRQEVSDTRYLLEQLGRLWQQGGVELDWAAFDGRARRQRLSLPTYPFQRQRFWLDTDLEKSLGAEGGLGSLLRLDTPASDASVHFYAPTWERQPFALARSKPPASPPSTYLLFCDDYGIAKALAEFVRSHRCRAILVLKDAIYKKHDEYLFSLDPARDDHYETLIGELRATYGSIDAIIYCWGILERPAGDESLAHITNRIQILEYRSLLFLARTLSAFQTSRTHISIVTNRLFEVIGTECLCPEQALLLGPCKIIPQEYKNITSSLIDLDLTPSENLSAEPLFRLLCEEIVAGSSDGVVALRGKHRWQQVFRSLELSNGEALPLRPQGTYIFTGGLGGVGLALAEALAKEVQANLVLVTRTSFPDRETWDDCLQEGHHQHSFAQKIHQLLAIERLGSRVIVASADVTNREQMRELVERTRQQFQTIHGVVHCAGVADGALIHTRTKAWDQHVLSAKVLGTLILDEVLAGLSLDFVVLCSALSAIVAPIGQVGYVAANTFLDAYAHYKNLSGSTRWLSIGWDSWKDAGMNVEASSTLQENLSLSEYREHLNQQSKGGFSREEGGSVFLRVLNESLSHIIISTTTLEKKYDEHYSSALLYTGQSSINRSPKADISLANPSDVERQISDIWKKFLGLETISPYDNWFDLGISSLDIIQLASILNTTLGTDVSVPQLFTFHTIQSLAGFISGKSPLTKDHTVLERRDEQVNEGKARLKKRLERTKRV